MEIPIYKRQNTIPAKTGGVAVSPEKVAEPYLAQAQQGAVLSKIGFEAAELNQRYLIAEQRAERTLALQEIEGTLDAGFSSVKQTIKETADHTAYNNIVASKATEIRKQIEDIKDPIVKQGALAKWQKETLKLQEFAREQKALLISQKSENLFLAKSARYADEIARETDEIKKLEKRMEIEEEGYVLEGSRTLQPGFTERHMITFDKNVNTLKEAYARDAKAAEVERQKAIKEQQTLQRENANKELVDINVSGKLNYGTLLKYRAVLDDKEYKAWAKTIEDNTDKAKKAATEGNGVFKTDKVLEAKIYRQIVKDPESISDAQIADYIGNGLSRSSAESLITDKRQRTQKDPARTAAEAAIVENMKRDRKAGLFGSDQAGDIEYAKQIDAFRRWSAAHPNDDPSEYYEKVMEPVKRSFIFDFLAKDKPNPKGARESMEQSGEIPQRRATDKKVADPLRDQAITILNQNKKPVTEANIEYVKKQLGSK